MQGSEHYFWMKYQAKVLILDRIKPCLDRDPPISVNQTQEVLMRVYNRDIASCVSRRYLCYLSSELFYIWIEVAGVYSHEFVHSNELKTGSVFLVWKVQNRFYVQLIRFCIGLVAETRSITHIKELLSNFCNLYIIEGI